jgi:amino-acid N-acetyltransferase
MGPIDFRAATPADLPALRRLLEEAALPADDLALDRQAFVLALDGGQVVGSIALEIAGEDALVRSLAVAPGHRRRGLAAALDERAGALARARGLSALYLLTTTARDYALRRGYELVERTAVPPAVAALPQFRSLCPASATCMRMRLGGGAPPGGGRGA